MRGETVLCEIKIKAAFLSAVTRKPTPIPEYIKVAMEG